MKRAIEVTVDMDLTSEEVAQALGKLRGAIEERDRWADEQTNSGENDPECGWAQYDEYMADHQARIAMRAEALVLALDPPQV